MGSKGDNNTRYGEDNRGSTLDRITRRRWLGVAATGLLAGCDGSGGGDQTETPTDASGGTDTEVQTTTEQTTSPSDLAHVSGQTFQHSISVSPDSLTFLATGGFNWPDRWGTRFAYQVWPLVHDHGAFGAWSNRAIGQGELNLTAYEDISISPEKVSATLKDDAKWSNGDDIIGRDAAAMILAWKSSQAGRSFEEIRNAPEEQTFPWSGITDAEWDGKTVTFYQDEGRFPADEPVGIWHSMFGGYRVWSGFWNNTRIEPYKTWADTIFEHWEATKNGEIDPWQNNEQFLVPKITKALEEAAPTGEMKHWLEHQQEPDNIVTSGAFQVSEINGEKNIILKKNPHFHAADRVNFDEVKVTTYRAERANWAALKSEELDLYDRGTIPKQTADSFPDQYERRHQRANTGIALSLNHRIDEGGFFTDVKVRQAIMYALNTGRISDAAHPSIHTPVKVPGAHAWGADEYLSEDWVSNNLRDYSQDLEKAAELLREAGWSRSGGQWKMPDGSDATLTIPTPKETPKMEPTVASQLSNFGISTSLQTYSGSVYNEKLGNGNEFDIWPGNRGVGWARHAIMKYWWFLIANQVWTKRWNIFENEEVQQVKYAIEEENLNGQFQPSIINPPTLENFSKVTVQAPEIGDWGGELKTWTPAGIAWSWKLDAEEKIKQLGWLINWHMPFLPISQQKQQQFLDAQHWNWPNKDFWKTNAVGTGTFQPEHLVGNGLVQANPDNPEEGATVEEK